MSENALTVVDKAPTAAIDWDTLEKVVIQGDLSKLQPEEKIAYYRTVCESIGLNPAMSPFAYLKLQGKETLYAQKNATDQLRRLYNVSIDRLEIAGDGDSYIVTAYASMPTGRRDSDQGIVNVRGLSGENLANAKLKAVTKAKRRVTLSICGLGFLDETEVETIPGAVVRPVAEPVQQQSTGLVDLRLNTSDQEAAEYAEKIRAKTEGQTAEPADTTVYDEAIEALRVLSGIRHTSGKTLMAEWTNLRGVTVRGFDALTSDQLVDIRDWARGESETAQTAPEVEEYVV